MKRLFALLVLVGIVDVVAGCGPSGCPDTGWAGKWNKGDFRQDIYTGEVIWDSRDHPVVIPNVNGGGVGDF